MTLKNNIFNLLYSEFKGKQGNRLLLYITILLVCIACEEESDITVWPKSKIPVAGFNIEPNPARINETVVFTNESSLEDGEIIEWLWDLGDQIFTTEQNSYRSFDSEGSYEISLTVTSSQGESTTLTQEVEVEALAIEIDLVSNSFDSNALHNGFYYGEVFTDSIIFKGMEMNFSLQGVSPIGTEFTWDFGDGTITNIPTPSHTYQADGQFYEVNVTAEESDGYTVNLTKRIYIPGIKWTFMGGKQELASPTLDSQQNIYLGGRNGIVYKIDSETGQQIWQFNAGDDVRSSIALSPDETKLYFGSFDDAFFAIDAATGVQLWKYTVGGRIDRSSPAVDPSGNSYFGCQDGVFRKLAPNGNLIWEYEVADVKIESSPLFYSDRVYVAMGHQIYAFDAGTGDVLWTYQIGEAEVTSYYGHFAMSTGGVLYAGGQNTDTKDGYVFALYAESGEQLWRASLPADVIGNSPLLSPDESTLYISTEDGDGDEMAYYAFDAYSGVQLWKTGNSDAFEFEDDLKVSGTLGNTGTIYVGDAGNYFYLLDASTGAVMLKFSVTDGDYSSSPAIGADGTLYLPNKVNNDDSEASLFALDIFGDLEGLPGTGWPVDGGNHTNRN